MDSELLMLLANLLASAIRILIPISLGALGSMMCERAGIIMIGIEGVMLLGAFAAVLGVYLTGSVLLGILFAVLSGLVISAVHATLTIIFKTGHIISGLAINLFASGITAVFMQAVWGTRGRSPTVARVEGVSIPFLRDIPVIGAIFDNLSPFFIVLIILVILLNFMLFRTVTGLRIRAIGENPRAVDSLGINVYRMQFVCVLVGGVIASLGGAYLSIGDIALFSRDMIAGRGFIAIAVNIFGGFSPFGIIGAGMLFGAAQGTQFRLQLMDIPVQLVQMLPYVLTILALAFVKKSRPPASAGKSFDREEA